MVQAARDFVIIAGKRCRANYGKPWAAPRFAGWTPTIWAAGWAKNRWPAPPCFISRAFGTVKADAELNATLPPISAPLFKGGFLAQFGDRSQLGIVPAVSWQFASAWQSAHAHLAFLCGNRPHRGAARLSARASRQIRYFRHWFCLAFFRQICPAAPVSGPAFCLLT